jgi:hypothetical protein
LTKRGVEYRVGVRHGFCSVSARFDPEVRADIEALLQEAKSQIRGLKRLYERALEEEEPSAKLRVRIKNVLENQRAALEYLANELTRAYGRPSLQTYYPVVPRPQAFPAQFDRRMEGVAATKPRIRDAIEARQPYQAGFEWLQHLVTLTNENKHRRLTPQRAVETTTRVTVQGQGAGVSWDPRLVRFGGGAGVGVRIVGAPIDPTTQMPVPTPGLAVTRTVVKDWLFHDPRLSALATVERIQRELPNLINDVLQAGRLKRLSSSRARS